MEKRINEKIAGEEKLKKENESYKRQLNFYKEKLKVDYINPIKKIDLNYVNNNNKSNNNTESKLMSPYKFIKPTHNGSNTSTINKSLHKKKISNNNVTEILINDINEKEEFVNENQQTLKNKKRVCSMDIKKKEKSNIDNNYNISLNSNGKSTIIKYLIFRRGKFKF